jgi:hypothetical protein
VPSSVPSSAAPAQRAGDQQAVSDAARVLGANRPAEIRGAHAQRLTSDVRGGLVPGYRHSAPSLHETQ